MKIDNNKLIIPDVELEDIRVTYDIDINKIEEVFRIILKIPKDMKVKEVIANMEYVTFTRNYIVRLLPNFRFK